MEFGLVGEHLKHSFSVEIHSLIGSYDYQLKEIAPDGLKDFLKRREFRGINVTIPYKQAVMPFLDRVSPEAERIGAVNTIVNRDGELYGYNTDYYGFALLAKRTGISFSGRNVLIYGRGGAAKAVAAVALDAGAVKVVQTGRDTDLSTSGIGRDFDILVNATPVGMFPATDVALPVSPEEFSHLEGVLDCIYNPLRTRLVCDAQMRGIPSDGGLYMLVAQAVKASELFRDKTLPPELADSVYDALLDIKRNTVIIGMPSCGKSTYARRLSRETGRAFVDTDRLIEETAGMSVTDMFAQRGEAEFRRLESEVIRDVSKWQGCIIATGGGTVLNPVNMLNLKMNGRIVYLRTALENLKTGGSRPLSKDTGALERIYAERRPLYEKYAEVTVNR